MSPRTLRLEIAVVRALLDAIERRTTEGHPAAEEIVTEMERAGAECFRVAAALEAAAARRVA